MSSNQEDKDSGSDDSAPKIHIQSPPAHYSAGNGAHQDTQQQPAASATAQGGGVAEILRRWKREDLLKRGSLALRALAFLFSLISFIIMASNKHGDWRNYDEYEELRYVLGIAILSTLYSGAQTFRQVHELSIGKQLFPQRMASIADFSADQIMAYLLISSASSAIPMTDRMREGADDIFTDSSAAAISMSIFAFLCLAVSALISGYKLSNEHHI